MAQGDRKGVHGQYIVHCFCCYIFLRRRTPHTPPVLQCVSHGRQCSRNFSKVRLQFFTNCSSKEPTLCGVQSCRNWLLQCGLLFPKRHWSCQKPVPGQPPCGATASSRHPHAPVWAPPGAAGECLSTMDVHGLQGHNCFTAGCRGISAPAAPSLRHLPQCLQSCPSHIVSLLSSLSAISFFFSLS